MLLLDGFGLADLYYVGTPLGVTGGIILGIGGISRGLREPDPFSADHILAATISGRRDALFGSIGIVCSFLLTAFNAEPPVNSLAWKPVVIALAVLFTYLLAYHFFKRGLLRHLLVMSLIDLPAPDHHHGDGKIRQLVVTAYLSGALSRVLARGYIESDSEGPERRTSYWKGFLPGAFGITADEFISGNDRNRFRKILKSIQILIGKI